MIWREWAAAAVAVVMMASPVVAGPVAFREAEPLPVPVLERDVGATLYPVFLPDGGAVLFGEFERIQGVERASVARLDSEGVVDTGYVWNGPELWSPMVSQRPEAVAVTPDGFVYFAEPGRFIGTFTGWIRRAKPDGQLDESFAVRAMNGDQPGGSLRLVAAADGGVAVLGCFDRLGDVATNGMGLIRANGVVDTGFRVGGADYPMGAFPVSGGRWLVVLQVGNPLEVRIVRLHADGSLDASFEAIAVPGDMRDPWVPSPHGFAEDDEGRLVFAEKDPDVEAAHGYGVRLRRVLPEGGFDPDFVVSLPPIGRIQPFGQVGIPPATQPPPEVDQVVPLPNGGVAVVATWLEPQAHGLVGVNAAGEIDASVLAAVESGYVRRLWRDGGDRLWALIGANWRPDLPARLVRLAPEGGVDLAIDARAPVTSALWEPHALDNGGVAVTGDFDVVADERRPGFFLLDGDGAPVALAAPLPWPRSEIVTVLPDGRIVVREAIPETFQPPSTGYRMTMDGAPEVVVVDRDGNWTALERRAEHVGETVASAAWTDVSGDVWIFFGERAIPGTAGVDVVRYGADGVLKAEVRLALEDGTHPWSRMEAAAGTADGAGMWALLRGAPSGGDEENRYHLVRTDAVGRVQRWKMLWLAPPEGRLAAKVAGLLAVPSGVLLAGDFAEVDGMPTPGLVRIEADGSIDAGWGGWLRAGTAVDGIRRVGAELLVVGALQTPEGARDAMLLDAAGLPSASALPEGVLAAFVGGMASSPDGRWWTEPGGRLFIPNTAKVRRWTAMAYPDFRLEASGAEPEPGMPLTLAVSGAGLDGAAIRWFRDGVALSETGPMLTVPVASGDEGAVFHAEVRLAGGETVFTSAWRLHFVPRRSRLTNASIRARLVDTEAPLIMGAVVSGSRPGVVLARALGPALGALGVQHPAGPLSLNLIGEGGAGILPPPAYVENAAVIGLNHPDVRATAAEVGALEPNLDLVAGNRQMVFEDVPSGSVFEHVRLSGSGEGGVVLAELYFPWARGDATSGVVLTNFSGRAVLDAADSVLVGGFVIEGEAPLEVLIRAVGPGLAALEVPAAARNPRLEVFRGETPVAANDDWDADAENGASVAAAGAAVGALPLGEGSADAAVVLTLEPGVYTAVVHPGGSEDYGREALLEIFVVPPQTDRR